MKTNYLYKVELQNKAKNNQEKTENERVSNFNKRNSDVNVFIKNVIQSPIFATIFTFLGNIKGLAHYLTQVPRLATGLFSAAFATEAADLLFSLKELKDAKNKNIGKWFDVLFSSNKLVLVGLAVFAPLAVVVVHYIFFSVMASLFTYNFSQLTYNIHKWRTTPTDTAENIALRAQYAANIKKYIVPTLITAALLIGALLVLVLAPYIPLTAVALAGVFTAGAILVGAIIGTSLYLNNRFNLGTKISNFFNNSFGLNKKASAKSLEKQNAKKPLLNNKQNVSSAPSSNKKSPISHPLQQTKLREIELVRISQQPAVKVNLEQPANGFPVEVNETTNPIRLKQRKYLIKEGLSKLIQLEAQRYTEKDSFLEKHAWSQDSKRYHKVELIKLLLGLLVADLPKNEITELNEANYAKLLSSAKDEALTVLNKQYSDFNKYPRFKKVESALQNNNDGKQEALTTTNSFAIQVDNIRQAIETAQGNVVAQIVNENNSNGATNLFDGIANSQDYKDHENNGAYQSFFVVTKGDVQNYAHAVESFYKPHLLSDAYKAYQGELAYKQEAPLLQK